MAWTSIIAIKPFLLLVLPVSKFACRVTDPASQYSASIHPECPPGSWSYIRLRDAPHAHGLASAKLGKSHHPRYPPCTRLSDTNQTMSNLKLRNPQTVKRIYSMKKILATFGVASAMSYPLMAQTPTLSGIAGSLPARDNALNIDWAYGWSVTAKNDLTHANYAYTPMILDATVGGKSTDELIQDVLDLRDVPGYDLEYVLGFNEPELPDQANLSVSDALVAWKKMSDAFTAEGVKLVSPAVSGTGPRALDDWLYPFMDAVDASLADTDPTNDMHVDAIGYHFYTVRYNAQDEADKLLNAIDTIWQKYQRPIWLTEFAGLFYANHSDTRLANRVAFNEQFLSILIPEFEKRDYVERYAWWQFGMGGTPYSALLTMEDGYYTPTALGEAYVKTVLESGESYDFVAGTTKPTDVHYLKGGTLTNTGSPLETALRAVYAMQGDSSIAGTSDWGFEVAEDAFVRIKNGATLRKQGTNTISMNGTLIDNDGFFHLGGGQLSLYGGASMIGSGTFYLNNGVLEIGATGESQTVDIDHQVVVNNANVRIAARSNASGKSHILNGTMTLNRSASFYGDGGLAVFGAIEGAGGINKYSGGALYLSGNNTYTGDSHLYAGTTYVTNATGSGTGTGQVYVYDGATLAGNGRVGGSVTLNGASKINPGVASSSTGLNNLPGFEAGVVLDAIDFDFAGANTGSPVTKTSSISQALELTSGITTAGGASVDTSSDETGALSVVGFSDATAWSSSDNYITFTVNPIDGLQMQLEDVTFKLRRDSVDSAHTFRIFTSIDGFSAWNAGLKNPLTLWVATTNTTTQTFTASYTGTELVSGPLEVRLYGWHANNATSAVHLEAASLDASFVSDPEHVIFDPVGALEIGGDYTQLEFATLALDIAGVGAGQFDQLIIDGAANLDGTLQLNFADGYLASDGDTFDIISAQSFTGNFSQIITPDGFDAQVIFNGDLAQLVVSVPEPSSLAILAVSGMGLLRRRRR